MLVLRTFSKGKDNGKKVILIDEDGRVYDNRRAIKSGLKAAGATVGTGALIGAGTLAGAGALIGHKVAGRKGAGAAIGGVGGGIYGAHKAIKPAIGVGAAYGLYRYAKGYKNKEKKNDSKD